jgi:hypothetical protein
VAVIFVVVAVMFDVVTVLVVVAVMFVVLVVILIVAGLTKKKSQKTSLSRCGGAPPGRPPSTRIRSVAKRHAHSRPPRRRLVEARSRGANGFNVVSLVKCNRIVSCLCFILLFCSPHTSQKRQQWRSRSVEVLLAVLSPRPFRQIA